MLTGTSAPLSTVRGRDDRRVGHARKLLDEVAASPLVKSRQRVQDHAEVLTPAWLVDAMLDLVQGESERIDSRFLEPACGDGNFLIRVLARKLATAKARYGKSEYELRHQALVALMSIYGIEIQADNAAECRSRLLLVFSAALGLNVDDDIARAARAVLQANIVHGDALTMRCIDPVADAPGPPIVFPEWGYLGRGRYQRRDFRFDALASRSTLQAGEHDHEVFKPVRSYPRMTVKELAV